MTVKTELGIIGYVSMVNEIVLEYFNADGVYQPHIGILNAMRLFYNECVKDSEFDDKLPHDNIDAMEMEELLADDEFIKAFNDALVGDGKIRLNFANAYKDAMEIVNVKKSSMGNAVLMVQKAIEGIATAIAPVLNNENITNIAAIAKDVISGKTTEDSIIHTYIQKMRDVENGVNENHLKVVAPETDK